MQHCLLITGTLTEKDDDNPAATRKYVYQRTKPGLGHWPLNATYDLQRRRHAVPYDPKTERQIQRRQHFKNAVTAWQSTTPTEREEAATLGRAYDLPAYHFFLKRFLAAEPLPPLSATPTPQVAFAIGKTEPLYNEYPIDGRAPNAQQIQISKNQRP